MTAIHMCMSMKLLLTICLCVVVDPSPELDVVEANRKFMEVSEELYDALIDCQWQPVEFAIEQEQMLSSIPEPISC